MEELKVASKRSRSSMSSVSLEEALEVAKKTDIHAEWMSLAESAKLYQETR